MKHFFTRLIALAIMVVAGSSSGAWAQSTANYAFTTNTTGSLALDANGNTVDMTTGTTTLLDATSNGGLVDDFSSALAGIGFSFTGMGTPYTQFSVNTNGAMLLGSTAIGTSGTTNYGSTTQFYIAPFGGDAAIAAGAGSASKIHYKVVGTAPNRCLVVEYNGMRQNYTGYATATTGDGTYQVRLYESVGIVEFMYGSMAISTAYSTGPIIGFSAGTTAGTIATVTSSANTVSTSATSFTNNTYSVGAIPSLNSTANGSRRFYRFTPPQAVPAAPITLAFSAVTANTTTVSWVDNSTNESFFVLTRATDAAFTQNVVTVNVPTTTSTGTGTTYTSAQSGLSAGTTYFYRVQAATEGTAPVGGLTGSQATSGAITYYWVGGATGGSWTIASNWNTNPDGSGTNRSTVSTSDILIVDGPNTTITSPNQTGQSLTIAVNSASYSIGQFQITGNTNLTLTSDVASTLRTITLTGAPGDEFSIASGSTLNMNNLTLPVAFAFSGSNNTGTIAGTLNLGGGASATTSNLLTTTGGTGTLVTVTGTINLDQSSNAGATASTTQPRLTSSTATLAFASGSTLNLNNILTVAPSIPLATWAATSNMNINGITTSTTAATNNAQAFGNITWNNPAATSANLINFFGSAAGSIQGNLTVTNAGAGTLRLASSTATVVIGGNVTVSAGTNTTNGALQGVTTGTLTINGNVNVNGGSFSPSSSTGTVIVNGNMTIASGAFYYVSNGATGSTNGILSFRGATFTNNGTITNVAAAAAGTLNFFSATNTAQTFAGTGTISGSLSVLGIQNSGGVTLTHTNQVTVQRVNLLNGTLTNSNKLTLGNAGTVATQVQYGGVNATTAGGNFDVAPTFALGTGTYTVNYNVENATRTTGFEIPATRAVNAITTSNAFGVIVSGGNLATGTLTFSSSSLFNTSASNVLTITGTTTGSVSGQSATAYVNGPLVRTLPASLATGSTYLFPVGKGGFYKPFSLVNPITTAGSTVTVQAEMFNGATGGTPTGLIGTLNNTRYWAASILTNAGNLTSSQIRLTDTPGTNDAIAASATQTGTYNIVSGTSATATINSDILSASATGAVLNGFGFYVMGQRAAPSLSNLAITPAGNQCTNVARTVTVTVTPGAAAITTVILSYQVNGGTAQTVTMTNTGGNNWSGTIPTVTPANGTVTWSVTATDGNNLTKSQTGTSYADQPATGVPLVATAGRTAVCVGDTTLLTLVVRGTLPTGYCTPTTVTNTSYFVDGFTTTGGTTNITNTGSGFSTSGFGNFTGQSVSQIMGGTVNFSLIMSSTAASGGSGVAIWVDWNRNGTFETTERVYNTSTYAYANLSGSFTVPANATAGSTRMRIMLDYNAGSPSTPCTITTTPQGEVEDYAFNVSPVISAFSWSDGATTLGTTNPLTATVSANTTYTGTATISGCPLMASVSVTTNPLPSSPTATNSSHCGNQTPTASVTSTSGAATPSFRWYTVQTGGTAIAGQTASALSNYPVSTTTTFYVSERNASGCESARTPVTVTVTAGPALTLNATSQNICNGAVGTLSVTSNLSNYDTYTWSPAAGLFTDAAATTPYTTGMSASTVYVKSATAGTTVYTLNALNSATSCSNSANDTVTIQSSYTITAAAARSSVCAGDTTLLTANVGGAATTGYCSPTATNQTNYYINNFATTGGLTNISSTNTGAAAANNYTDFSATRTITALQGATINVTASFGLSATADFGVSVFVDWNRDGVFATTERVATTSGYVINYAGSFAVPANASFGKTRMRVVADFSNTSPTATCTAPSSGEIEDYAFNVSPVVSAYSWSDGATTLSTNNPYTAMVNATTTYTVTATIGGCPNTGSVAVTARPLPTAPTANNGTHCGTATPLASVTSTSGASTPSFRWYLQATGGTALSGQTASTLSNYPVSATTTFYVSEMSAAGCEGPRVTVTETVISAPVLTLNATTQNVCNGNVATLAVTSNTSDYDTYIWSPVDSLYADAAATVSYTTGSNATTVYLKSTRAATTVYTLNASNSLTGCSNVARDTVTVQPNYTPVATVNTATVCAGTTDTFTLRVTQPGTAQVGTGTATSSTSFNGSSFYGTYWGNSRQQWLITAAELNAAGVAPGPLTALSINVIAVGNPTTMNNLTIKMGQTTATALTTSFVSGLTQVWTAATYTPVVGTNTHTLGSGSGSSGFTWDGVSNIVVENCYGNNTTGVTDATNTFTAPGYNSSVNSGNDGTTSAATICTTATGTIRTNRPNITFAGSVATIPATGVVWTAGATQVGTTNPLYTTVNATATYTGSTTINGCALSASVNVMANPTPAAPTATNSTQCGTKTPTASVTSTSGLSNPTFRWYTLQAGGTPIAAQNGAMLMNYPVSATTTFYVSEFAGVCEGPRVAVTVTVNAAPALAASARTSLCNRLVKALTVTSTQSNYDTYTWSPVDSLYTDAAATVPYTVGTNAATVYLKSTKVGDNVYTLTGINSVSGCQSTVNDTTNVLPAVAVSAAPTSICVSGTPTVTLANSAAFTAAGSGAMIAWATSTDSVNFTTVSGATAGTYTPQNPITASTFYRVTITDGNGNTCAPTPAVGVVVSNPTIASTTPASRCGTGTVTLNATGSTGANLNWYAAQTGGNVLFTGANYTTPSISATTTYYVGASTVPVVQSGLGNVGVPTPNNTGLSSNRGIVVSISQSGTLNTAQFYAAATGAYAGTASLVDNASGTTVQSTPFSGTAAAVGFQTLNLNWPMTAGNTYRLLLTLTTGSYANSTVGVDYTSSTWNNFGTAGTVVTGYNTSGADATIYSSFYNMQYTSVCESPRTAVTATVTPATAVTLNNTSQTLCNGAVGTVSVTSNLSDYDQYTWTPTTGLFTDAAATTAYTNGTSASTVYIKSNTGGTTVYTLTALNTTSNCSNTATDTVTIQPFYSVTATAGRTTVCAGDTTLLTATVGGTAPTGYCTPTTTGATTYNITNFTTTGATVNVNKNSSATTNYEDFSGTNTVTASAGATINYSMTVSGGSTYGPAIWIDLNGNGVFTDAGEQVVLNSAGYLGSPITGSFTVPANTTLGPKRMRIAAAYSPSNPSNSCVLGGAGQYEDYGFSVQPAASYTWSNGAGTVGTTNPLTATVTATTTYTASLSINGCPVSGSVTVTANPVAPITVAASKTAVCRGAADTLIASSSNNNYNYSWNTTPVQNGATAYIAPTATRFYTVTATDGTSGCVRKDSVQVSVEQPLTVTVSPASSTIGCGGNAVQLTATVNTTGTITKATWKPVGFVAGNTLAGLYTDAAATTAYDSTAAPTALTVYAKNNADIAYNIAVSTAICPAVMSNTTTLSVTASTGNGLANGTAAQNTTYYTQSGTDTIQNANCQTIVSVAPSGANPVSGPVMTTVYNAGAGAPTIASGRPYVPRYYQVTPQNNPATATGTLTLYATNAEFKAYNTAAADSNSRIAFIDSVQYKSIALPLLPDADTASTSSRSSNVLISKESGTSATGTPGTFSPGIKKAIRPSSVVWNSTENRWELTFSTVGFSGFFITGGGSSAGPLPVTFTGIAATAETGRNRVEWNVGSESNVARYEVEKLSGNSYERIGTIPAAGMAQYVYYDAAPSKGLNTYRVKAVDVDGTYSYSPIANVVVKDGSGFALELFPNPTTDKVTVRSNGSTATEATVTVSELSGRLILNQVVKAADAQIDLSALPAGTYMLQWSDGVNKESVRVTKQ